jgi:Skp family chaperone for outer membrane proteins
MLRWRGLAGAAAVAALIGSAGAGAAQDGTASPILTIDRERLFVESDFGKAVLARETARAQELEAENARIESDLIAEEQDLTDRRATLSAEEFSALALAFDEKVVRIRAEQDEKARNLTQLRETDRKAFFRTAGPVLGDLLVERKAVAIFDTSATILALTAIDVTDAAIAKVDAALKPGVDAGDANLSPDGAPDPALVTDPAITPAPSP